MARARAEKENARCQAEPPAVRRDLHEDRGRSMTTATGMTAANQSPPTPQHMAIPLRNLEPTSHKPALIHADGRPTPFGWRKIAELLARPMATRAFRGRGGGCVR